MRYPIRVLVWAILVGSAAHDDSEPPLRGALVGEGDEDQVPELRAGHSRTVAAVVAAVVTLPDSPKYQSSWRRAVRGTQHKLIREHGIDTQLYDLSANPLELVTGSPPLGNLIGLSAYSTVQSQLSSAMNSTFGLARCSGGTDIDGDLVCDISDNCVLLAEQGQVDADGDGYGNPCDGDFNQSMLVNIPDFGTFKLCFLKDLPLVPENSGPTDDQSCTESDMVPSPKVNILDFGLWKRAHEKAPGLSCGFTEGESCRGPLQ